MDYKKRAELIKALSEQQYFDARLKNESESARIGDRDGMTGRHLVLRQDGGVTSNGVKTFNTALPTDGFVRNIQGANAIALDHRNMRSPQRARKATDEIAEPNLVNILLRNFNDFNDFYIGGDRDPELIYSIPAGFHYRSANINASESGYIVNILISDNFLLELSVNFRFISINNESVTEVDFTPHIYPSVGFSSDSYFYSLSNDYLWINKGHRTITTNYNYSVFPRQLLGYSGTTYEWYSGFVNIKNATQDQGLGVGMISLSSNGLTSASGSVAIAYTPQLNGTGLINLSCVALNDNPITDVTFGTRDLLAATSLDQQYTLFLNSTSGNFEFYVGSTLLYSYIGYIHPTPDGYIFPLSFSDRFSGSLFYLNIQDTKFTGVREVNTSTKKVRYYNGEFGASISFSDLIEIDYTDFNSTDIAYAVVSASVSVV